MFNYVIAGVDNKYNVQMSCKLLADVYELLVFFSLASTKKRPHTLQRSLTSVMWCSIPKATPIIH